MGSGQNLRRLVPVSLFLAIAVLMASSVPAQCVMCGLSAEQASDPDTVNRTFNAAVLVLLVPLLGMIGALAAVTWKMRHWDGAVMQDDDPVSREDLDVL